MVLVRKLWSQEDITTLLAIQELYPFNYDKMCEALPHLTREAIRKKVSRLGFSQPYNQEIKAAKDREAAELGIYPKFFEGFRRGAERAKGGGRTKEFTITIPYVVQLFADQKGLCYISGVPITLPMTYAEYGKSLQTASLDRIDSSIGYVEGNVSWVHKELNMLKGTMSNSDLINWAHTISRNNL